MGKKKRQRQKLMNRNKTISEPKQESTDNKTKKSFGDVITQPEVIIAIGIVGLYVFTYAYYMGYYRNYHIPMLYLDLDLNKLTTPSFMYFTIILLIFIPNYLYFNFMDTLYKNDEQLKKKLKRKRMKILAISLFVTFLFIFSFGVLWELEHLYNLNLSVIDKCVFLLFCMTALGLTLYNTHLFANSQKNTELLVLYPFSLFMLLFVCSYQMGTLSTHKSTYPVLIENGKQQQKIILDTCKELYIVSPYQKVKNGYQLTGEIELVEIKNQSPASPQEINITNHKYNLKYETKTTKIKEIPIKNLLFPK
jgi:hypothetical protein